MFKTNTKFGSFSSTPTGFNSDKISSSSSNQNAKTGGSSKDSNKINSNDFVPKRFGLKFDPPTISKKSSIFRTF